MDRIELTRYEVAEYPFSRFVSDVGGSFGLFLGISAATLVGFAEMIVQIVFRTLYRLVGELVLFLRNNFLSSFSSFSYRQKNPFIFMIYETVILKLNFSDTSKGPTRFQKRQPSAAINSYTSFSTQD